MPPPLEPEGWNLASGGEGGGRYQIWDAVVDGGASEVEAGEGEGQGLDPWRNNREFDIAIEGLREAWGTVQQRKSAGSIQVSCILFIQVLYYIIFCIIYMCVCVYIYIYI